MPQRDWEGIAYSAVARLRALVGPDVEDPRLAELVSELSVRSDEFRRLWARHDIQISAPRIHSFNHPLVGCLELKPERLSIIGTEGQVLIVHHAEPGSPSERALRLLAGVAAGEHRQDTLEGNARPSSTCGASAGRG